MRTVLDEANTNIIVTGARCQRLRLPPLPGCAQMAARAVAVAVRGRRERNVRATPCSHASCCRCRCWAVSTCTLAALRHQQWRTPKPLACTSKPLTCTPQPRACNAHRAAGRGPAPLQTAALLFLHVLIPRAGRPQQVAARKRDIATPPLSTLRLTAPVIRA